MRRIVKLPMYAQRHPAALPQVLRDSAVDCTAHTPKKFSSLVRPISVSLGRMGFPRASATSIYFNEGTAQQKSLCHFAPVSTQIRVASQVAKWASAIDGITCMHANILVKNEITGMSKKKLER